MTADSPLIRMYRKHELPPFVGLRRSAIEKLIRMGRFPAPIPLNDVGNAVAWPETVLVAWQQEFLSNGQRLAAQRAAARRAREAAFEAAVQRALEDGSELPTRSQMK